jgi:hypothetical protein
MRRMLAVFLVLLAFGLAQTRVVLGVGGKTAVIYLPLTVTERLGFFREEGLDVVIQDFGAGARSRPQGVACKGGHRLLQRDSGKGVGEEDPRPGAAHRQEGSRDRPPKKAEPTLRVTLGQGR